MKILKMRASFGKLQGELELREGMNVLTLPNEEGKSTWTAFMITMLYGLDTKERGNAANFGLPAKERYRPWNGKPMEGSMEIEWKGRYITIERKSGAKSPMGIFRAYDTKTGRPIEALSADNCGRVLCGVERTVFERTAFIRQLGISVNADDALEKRLGALVSTGEESAKSAAQLEKELHGLKNQLVGRSGRIPKLQTELTETERLHTVMCRLQEETQDLSQEKAKLEAEKNRLEQLLQRVDKAKQSRGHAALEELSQKLEEQEELCAKLEATVRDLPSEGELHELQRKLETSQSNLETARMEAAFAPAPTPKPKAPNCFADLTAEKAKRKVEQDRQDYQELTESKPPKKMLPLALCALVLLSGIVIGVLSYLNLLPLQLWVGPCVAAVGLIAFVVVLIVLNRKTKQHQLALEQAEAILEHYEIEEISQIEELLQNYTKEQSDYEALVAEEEEQIQKLQKQVQQAQEESDKILNTIVAFAPDCTTVADGRQALSAGLLARSTLETERRVLENQRLQHESMRKLFGDHREKIDYEALNMDESRLRYEHKAVLQKLLNVAGRLAERRGRMDATGKTAMLDERREKLRNQLVEAQLSLQGIEIALSALRAADDRLRSRFSPRITAEAGKILGELTRGKYPAVQLSPDMQLSVRDGVLQRPAAAMSCGTSDQMYLALRMAMSRMLLPEDAPLILDDALVNFDDDRCKAALQVLSREAESRQVILFTCRTL